MYEEMNIITKPKAVLELYESGIPPVGIGNHADLCQSAATTRRVYK
jgi:hypothetical protein